jgi:hypothetical protein
MNFAALWGRLGVVLHEGCWVQSVAVAETGLMLLTLSKNVFGSECSGQCLWNNVSGACRVRDHGA